MLYQRTDDGKLAILLRNLDKFDPNYLSAVNIAPAETIVSNISVKTVLKLVIVITEAAPAFFNFY